MHKLRIGMCFALGLGMGLSFHVTGAQAGPRPGSDLDLFTRLNGEITRPRNALGGANNDGGGLSLYSVDAGPGCNNVPTGGVYEIHCNTAGHFCPWGDDGGAGLAVCGTTIGNISYGKPVNASTPMAPYPIFYTAPRGEYGTTKSICFTPAAGTLSGTCAVFPIQ